MLTTYRATEGLSRFPSDRRLSVYRTAHKELLAADPAYRKACRELSFTLCAEAILPTVPSIFQWAGALSTNSALLLGLVLSAVCLLMILATASAAQHFRNTAIAAHLEQTRPHSQ